MSMEERDDLFRLVMQYHDDELPELEKARVRGLIEEDPQASAWLHDMEAMGDATFEFVREAVEQEDFSEYWVTVDEGVRSPTPELRKRKQRADQVGLVPWLRRNLGTWLVPAGGLAVAGAAALIVLAVGVPWVMTNSNDAVTADDWSGLAAVDNTLEIDDIEGDEWAVSIVAAGEDAPMIIWLDDLAVPKEQG